ncbi:MAG: DUF3300 domain-containing protein [Bryobacteraceae bacterium]
MRTTQGIRRAFRLAVVPFLAAGMMLAQQAPPPPGQVPPGQVPPGQAPAPRLIPQQLDTLVAPVALYPDNLLGELLAASTYPLEITEAAQWLQQNPNLQGQQLVAAAQQQNWDPSVQALVVFPDVLTRLASDIRWTTDLGNAFLTQQADVMNAVQRMRAQAAASGKLRSNPQQTVTTEQQGDQSAIDIAPANPEEVYVPSYNPEYIWGPPEDGYYPPWDYLDIGYGGGYGFGPGIYLGGFFGGLGWGGWGWGLNWFRCGLFLNGGFFGHYGFHGLGYGGGGGWWAHNGFHRQGVGYSSRALNSRYGAASAAGARSAYSASAGRYSSGFRGSTGAAGGWNHFSQGGANGYRSSQSSGGNYARSATPSYRGTYGGGNAYRSSPGYSYGGRSAAPSYRGSYGGGSHYSAPSYRGGSGGGYHSSGGGSYHSSGGGGGFHGGGGGGGFHGGGGGGHGGGGHR